MTALRGLTWLVAVAMMAGCGASSTTRVVVPLQGNDAGEVAAESCVLRCRASNNIERCMVGCPGAVVLAGSCRHDEAPPVAMCRISESGPLVYRVNAWSGDWRPTPPPDAAQEGDGESLSAASEVVGGLLTSAIGAALSSNSSSGSSEPSRVSTPSPTGVRTATRSEPVRSSHEGRTSASPSRGESSSGRTMASPKHSEPGEKASKRGR